MGEFRFYIRRKRRFLCPFGRFSVLTGGIFHGEQAGTDTGKQSAQKTGIDTGTRGNNRRIAGKADGDCLTGGNRQGTGKGKQGKRKQGKGNITGYYVAFYV